MNKHLRTHGLLPKTTEMKTVCDAAERYYEIPPPAEVLDPVVQRIKRLDSPEAGKFSAALQRMDTVLTVPLSVEDDQ